MPIEFREATAVITGGATGIGLALAEALSREGAKIVIASTSAERIAAAVDRIQSQGGRAHGVVCDVSSRDEVAALLDGAIARFGSVELLCANAGVTTGGAFLDHRPEDWDWVYDVVLRGVTNCIEAFYPYMAARRRGQIMITGSQAGMTPDWVLGHGPYTSAKAAVMALGVALRPEAAEHNVGVSVMIPAGVPSDILKTGRSRGARHGGPTGPAPSPYPRPGAPRPAEGLPARLPAEVVAARALAGLRENRAVIATHPAMKPLVKEYFERLLAAWDEASDAPA